MNEIVILSYSIYSYRDIPCSNSLNLVAFDMEFLQEITSLCIFSISKIIALTTKSRYKIKSIWEDDDDEEEEVKEEEEEEEEEGEEEVGKRRRRKREGKKIQDGGTFMFRICKNLHYLLLPTSTYIYLHLPTST